MVLNPKRNSEAVILGGFVCLGLALLGYLVSEGALRFKALERSVTVKGLSEREVPADTAIWPIKFNEAENNLNTLFETIQRKTALVVGFLRESGFASEEISVSAPAIVDRQAQGYADANRIPFRYAGNSTITVYTPKVATVRTTMTRLVNLGKQGVAITGEDYSAKTEFLFSRLNEIKPAMVEEATNNAREVAEKFAQDSQSKLGRIRRASQGQFSIADRDSTTPHIKKVRVVSTVEYYLTD